MGTDDIAVCAIAVTLFGAGPGADPVRPVPCLDGNTRDRRTSHRFCAGSRDGVPGASSPDGDEVGVVAGRCLSEWDRTLRNDENFACFGRDDGLDSMAVVQRPESTVRVPSGTASSCNWSCNWLPVESCRTLLGRDGCGV